MLVKIILFLGQTLSKINITPHWICRQWPRSDFLIFCIHGSFVLFASGKAPSIHSSVCVYNILTGCVNIYCEREKKNHSFSDAVWWCAMVAEYSYYTCHDWRIVMYCEKIDQHSLCCHLFDSKNRFPTNLKYEWKYVSETGPGFVCWGEYGWCPEPFLNVRKIYASENFVLERLSSNSLFLTITNSQPSVIGCFSGNQ